MALRAASRAVTEAALATDVGYWHVADIQRSLQALLDAGAEAQQPAKDVGGAKLVASVKDADANVIGLIQPG